MTNAPVVYPWHQDMLAHIETMVAEGRTPHALLFRHRPDYFDTELGWQLVKRILCGMDTDGDAAQHCRFVDDNSHPNVLYLDVRTDKVGIADIRLLEQQIWQTALFDKPKIAFINGMDLLSISAQNALLKTLEEPPKNAFFMLSVDNISRVLPTIMSRVQRLRHTPAATDVVISWLRDQIQQQSISKTDADIETIAQLVDYVPERALSLLQSDEQVKSLENEKAQFAQFISGKCSVNALVSSLSDADIAAVLSRYCGYVERLIRLLFDKTVAANEKKSENSLDYSRWHGVSLVGLYRLHDVLVELRQLSNSNVNMTMQLTSSLSDWQYDRTK